jgi:hypothetical protein
MSSLWTPDGDRPVSREAAPGDPTEPAATPEDAEVEAEMARLQQELANTPAADIITNHCLGFFQLAALHLSQQPPKLGEAQLAIDALAAVVEGLQGRLGTDEAEVRQALAQLRLAFVQIRAANLGAAEPPPDPAANGQ